MVIAIVDDGICKSEISTPVETYRVGSMKEKGTVQNNHESHATVCAKIIEKYCKPDKFIDVVFLDADGSAKITDMCLALEFCCDLNADVINLSNGIEIYDKKTDEYKRLLGICRKLYYKGVKIYAAQSNHGGQTIPANFPYTISVEQLDKKQNKICSLYRKSDIYTNGRHTVSINGKKTRTIKCNSYACAYAAGHDAAGKKDRAGRFFLSGRITSELSFYSTAPGEGTDKNELYTLFLDDKSSPEGVICAEKLSSRKKRELKEKNLKYLVTETSLDEKFIARAAQTCGQEEIPIVYIAHCSGAVAFAERISSFLFEAGYNASVISTNRDDLLKGAYYASMSSLQSYIRIFSFYNKCDILLVVTDGGEADGRDKDDIVIKLAADDDIIISSGDEKKNVNNENEAAEAILAYYS